MLVLTAVSLLMIPLSLGLRENPAGAAGLGGTAYTRARIYWRCSMLYARWHQLGSFVGGWGAGRWYDVEGNYDLVWWASVGFGIIAAAIHWFIREEPVARLAPSPA